MKLTKEDLTLLMDECRKEWLEMSPNVCFVGTSKPLTESQIIAASWFQASINVLNKKMLLDDLEFENKSLEFDLPDSTPMPEEGQ